MGNEYRSGGDGLQPNERMLGKTGRTSTVCGHSNLHRHTQTPSHSDFARNRLSQIIKQHCSLIINLMNFEFRTKIGRA